MRALHPGCQHGRVGPPASLSSGVSFSEDQMKNDMFTNPEGWAQKAAGSLTDAKGEHYKTAITYVASRRDKRDKSADNTYPLNRGDLMVLVVLIDQELQANPPIADPIRLAAVREKLGDLVCDALEMSKEEAQKFK